MSDKWTDGVRKTVRFGWARRIPEEMNEEENLEEKAVATLHCLYRCQQAM